MRHPLVRSANGTIAVRTTERGLPLAVHLVDAELTRSPQQLAHEILALCRVAAGRAQVAHRHALAEKGFHPSVIRGLHLTTEDQLSELERQAFGDDDAPPTWMRSV